MKNQLHKKFTSFVASGIAKIGKVKGNVPKAALSRRGKIIMIGLIGITVIGSCLWWFNSAMSRRPAYRTAEVRRGSLDATISATGTVEPEEVVDVGAQVSGIVSSFGTDRHGKMIDYRSIVEENMILAKVDDQLYAATVDSAIANKSSAEANVLQMEAQLLHALLDWERAQKLGPSDALSKSAYDQYQANFEIAKANLEAAKATVKQAIANLRSAQVNLGYCTIRSPIKGVIVDRRVNIGQTVVSSMNATSLFLIAKDLKRIQVWVSVNEADIGSISIRQPVEFTVDAYPKRIFHGTVGRIRLNATMTQNVVTYTVEVNTKNEDGKLLPYLTANAKFLVGHLENVMLVPNAALRWSPVPSQIAPDARRTPRTRPEPQGAERESSSQSWGTIWTPHGRYVLPARVKVGLSDGIMTEVEGRDLIVGMQAIIGEETPGVKAGPEGERNPFTPQINRGRR
jgi:HlyD family secretion protein